MIDKNFYLENLSAFDILIEDDDRKEAEAVVFRVFSMLQRDKIWLREVATEDEIYEEDVQLLQEVEEELQELDEKYGFRFEEFYQLVQREMKRIQSTPNEDFTQNDDLNNNGDALSEEEDDYEEDDYEDDDYEDDDDFYDADGDDAFGHLSDEELNLIEDFILSSAKTRFNFPLFVQDFPEGDEVFVEGEFLLPLIAGKAYGDSDTEIAEKMRSSFTMWGYPIEMNDLLPMIKEKGKELGSEILAFKIAADSLQQGAHPRDIVRQLEQLLNR